MSRTSSCCISIFLLATVAAASSSLADDVGKPILTMTKEQCDKLTDPDWHKGETYVWEQACLGQDANLLTEFPGDSDPMHVEKWPAQRTLGDRFLETILLKEKYRRALTRKGVRIVGARFEKRLDLENAEIRHELWLNNSRLHQGARFTGLKSTRHLILQGSVVSDKDDSNEEQSSENLTLDGAEIGGNLYLDGRSTFRNVSLSNTVVHGELALGESTYIGEFSADGLSAGSISSDNTAGAARFMNKVTLTRVSIKGDLALNSEAKFEGDLDLTGAKIEGNLAFDSGEFFQRITLRGAKIGGDLDLHAAQFRGPINLEGAQIGGDLKLVLDGEPARWSGPTATLNFSNAKAERIPDICNAWPAKMDFTGFVYRAVGSIPSEHECKNALDVWLDKLISLPPPDGQVTELRSTQPYEQLATILQAQGDITNATYVRFRARDKERQQAELGSLTGFIRWIFIWVAKIFVGYGYYPQIALFWVGILLIAGIAVMRGSGQAMFHGLPWCGAAYTLDMLLPLIRLRDKHYTIKLIGWAGTYFYFHKVMGYVLASLLIAAAAGVGK